MWSTVRARPHGTDEGPRHTAGPENGAQAVDGGVNLKRCERGSQGRRKAGQGRAGAEVALDQGGQGKAREGGMQAGVMGLAVTWSRTRLSLG